MYYIVDIICSVIMTKVKGELIRIVHHLACRRGSLSHLVAVAEKSPSWRFFLVPPDLAPSTHGYYRGRVKANVITSLVL